MIKKISVLTGFLLALFLSTSTVSAMSDPTLVPNNKFGIHITSENDLTDATALINSSGGDWGYVTVVITEAERNHDRWQTVFDQMRKSHVIPIIRLATKMENGTWQIPQEAEINNWIAFLNSLNWVTQNRYIIISNEPNHAKEWGGKLDPTGYATYLNNFAQKLHEASPDFFILPAGMDASANNSTFTMDEALYLKRMLISTPKLFENLDGWVSHSYPNPGFAGSELSTGRGTIDTFNWELTYLKTLGVTKNLPVFITETGWSNQKIDSNKIGSMYRYAFENVWNDSKVVAVTPFILNYTQSPFAEFSWKKDDKTFYPFYSEIQKIPKPIGAPVQIVTGQIVGAFAQPIIPVGSDYLGAIFARNTGQSIWNSNNISIASSANDVRIKSYSLSDIEPTKLGLIIFKSSAPENTGIYSKSLFLQTKDGKRITNDFPIEAVLIKVDKMQVQAFFDRIGAYISNALHLGL